MKLFAVSTRNQALAALYFSYTLRSQRAALEKRWQEYNQNLDTSQKKLGNVTNIPDAHWTLLAYHWLSTSAHVANAIVVSLLQMGTLHNSHQSATPEQCAYDVAQEADFTMGLSQSLLVQFGGLISGLHLFWRTTMQVYGPRMRLDALIFLIDDQFERRATRQGARIVRLPPSQTSNSTSRRSALARQVTDSDQPSALNFYDALLYRRESDYCNRFTTKTTAAVCQPAVYRLRPNRTSESRRKLAQVLAFGCKFFALVIIGNSLLLAPFCKTFFLIHHESLLLAHCTLTGTVTNVNVNRRSPTPMASSLAHLLSPLIVCIIFLDSVLAIGLSAPYVSVLANDLFIAWRDVCYHMGATARLIYRQPPKPPPSLLPTSDAHRQYAATSALTTAQFSFNHWNNNHCQHHHSQSSQKAPPTRAIAAKMVCYDPTWIEWCLYEQRLENSFVSLKASMRDFMRQSRDADVFMSIMLATSLLTWFSMTLLLTVKGISLDNSSGKVWVRAFQWMAFLMLISVCYFFLRLKTIVEPAYLFLCSLTAHDPTNAKASRWLPLLAYFSGPKKMYGVTLWFNGHLFTNLVGIKIVAYTFSLIFLYETYKRSKQYQR